MAARTNPSVTAASEALRFAGLSAELIGENFNPDFFGNAVAIFRLGSLFLKFSRDRSLDSLEVASVFSSRFVQFEDVQVALRWRTFDEIFAAGKPETLEDMLTQVSAHIEELSLALAGNLDRFGEAEVRRAARLDPFAPRSKSN